MRPSPASAAGARPVVVRPVVVRYRLRRRDLEAEAGASSIASVFGVAIFLGFMLLSTQVLVHLYASSTVSAVAFDAARRASAAGGSCAAAEVDARNRLGSWGSQSGVVVTCVPTGDGRTEVGISGPSPARGLRIFGAGVVDRIDRGASFRTETGR